MSLRFARRRDDLLVTLGDANGTVRVGVTDWVCVRLGPISAPTDFALALLPRAAVSVNATTAASAELLDDLLLPAAGTNLMAEWITDPRGPAALRIDISSLPAAV